MRLTTALMTRSTCARLSSSTLLSVRIFLGDVHLCLALSVTRLSTAFPPSLSMPSSDARFVSPPSSYNSRTPSSSRCRPVKIAPSSPRFAPPPSSRHRPPSRLRRPQSSALRGLQLRQVESPPKMIRRGSRPPPVLATAPRRVASREKCAGSSRIRKDASRVESLNPADASSPPHLCAPTLLTAAAPRILLSQEPKRRRRDGHQLHAGWMCRAGMDRRGSGFFSRRPVAPTSLARYLPCPLETTTATSTTFRPTTITNYAPERTTARRPRCATDWGHLASSHATVSLSSSARPAVFFSALITEPRRQGTRRPPAPSRSGFVIIKARRRQGPPSFTRRSSQRTATRAHAAKAPQMF
ncbi:hypothetical protein B0H17DRAFT_1326473 [Mycena rosella]|uniref:Uncharacterized protein n=1 Tax=Mycena rosella TaxID=1033263 RepID=A0AAD7M733_MYCRO|nr:hypothetical protein B0H17DRAFT_1326473 [Mycena rosella]